MKPFTIRYLIDCGCVFQEKVVNIIASLDSAQEFITNHISPIIVQVSCFLFLISMPVSGCATVTTRFNRVGCSHANSFTTLGFLSRKVRSMEM